MSWPWCLPEYWMKMEQNVSGILDVWWPAKRIVHTGQTYSNNGYGSKGNNKIILHHLHVISSKKKFKKNKIKSDGTSLQFASIFASYYYIQYWSSVTINPRSSKFNRHVCLKQLHRFGPRGHATLPSHSVIFFNLSKKKQIKTDSSDLQNQI